MSLVQKDFSMKESVTQQSLIVQTLKGKEPFVVPNKLGEMKLGSYIFEQIRFGSNVFREQTLVKKIWVDEFWVVKKFYAKNFCYQKNIGPKNEMFT